MDGNNLLRLRYHNLLPGDDLNWSLPRTPYFSPPIHLKHRDAGSFSPPFELREPEYSSHDVVNMLEPIMARAAFGPVILARDAGNYLGNLLRGDHAR